MASTPTSATSPPSTRGLCASWGRLRFTGARSPVWRMSSWASISASDYGRLGESAGAWLLRLHGYRIVGRRRRVAGFEIDLLARRGGLLVVCEVKARRSVRRGTPLEAVDARRQASMRRAAEMLAATD